MLQQRIPLLLSVATEAQQGANSSSVVQSFFRAELRAIKDKQVQQGQKLDKAIAQLQQIEEPLCYALLILKRTRPSDPAGPSNL